MDFEIKKLIVVSALLAILLSGCISSPTTRESDKRIGVTQVTNNPGFNYTPPSEYDPSSEPIKKFNNSSFGDIPGARKLLSRVSSNESKYHASMPANESQLSELRQAYNKTPNGLFKYKGEVYKIGQG